MDEIQTMVYCPGCGAEVKLLLKRQEIPEDLRRIIKVLNLPSSGEENAYKGKVKCSCGKMVSATFVFQVIDENERSQEVVTSGGIL
jgi:hypothetical protein